MPIIETFDLTRKYGSFCAVEGLNLRVEAGEVLGFLGPNGAGKTTTIRMLAGMIAPTSGYAVINGLRTDGPVEKLHEVTGLLTESPGFYNRLSARRNLEYFAGFYPGIDARAQTEKYLRLMGLQERSLAPAGSFSKGMKQRLALARALIHEPRVLFLDEPTSGLDPEAAEEVRKLIRKLSGEGRTVFLSTHNLTEAEQLCHRIAIFRIRLLALDTPQELHRKAFRSRTIIRLEKVTGEIMEAVKRLGLETGLEQEGERLILEMKDDQKGLPEVVRSIVEAGGSVLEVTEERHTLEEIYLSLVREEAGA